MRGIDAQDDKLLPRGTVFQLDISLLAQEILVLVELDQAVETHLLRPVFR